MIAKQAQMIRHNSKAAKPHYSLGKLLEKKGEVDEAIASYQKAIERNPYSIDFYHNLAALLVKKGSDKDAVKIYQKAIQFNPKNLDLYHRLGEVFLKKGDFDKAIAVYEKSIEIAPDVSWSYNNLGDALAKQEKWERAIEAYRKAIELKPDFFWSYHNLAEALFKLKKWQESIIAYREAIKLNPDVISSYENLAKALIKTEKWAEAADIYKEAIALKPDAFWYHKNLGDALLKQQKWEEASAAYSRVMELKADLICSSENLGWAQLKAKKWADAEATYKQAIAQNSKVFWYHKNLGDALSKQDKNDEAILAYRRASQVAPEREESYHKLGEALVKKGEISEAIFCYKKAQKLNPNSLWVYVKLADALAKLGEWQEAIASYKKAIDIEPDLHVAIYNRLADALQAEKTTARAIEAEIIVPPSVTKTPEKWPYIAPKNRNWPTTLPDGSPWSKISIVTPSYNRGKFIEETILSIVNQDYPNVEYILIDGGSTDETMTVVDRYREHFSYVASEPDSGQSNALNKGFSRATGDILTWVNSDDRLAPGALYAIALAFHTSKADIVAGICQVFENDIQVDAHITSCLNGVLPLEDILDIENSWLTGKFFYQPEVMFSRKIWERAGSSINESLYYSMDYELWARFAAAGARLHVIGVPTAQYRLHPEQKTSTTEKYTPELTKTRDILRVQLNCPAPEKRAIAPKRNSLRVVFFNDIGFLGGAGIAHKRIAQAFTLAGHQVIPIAARGEWSFAPADISVTDVYNLIASIEPDLVVVGNVHNIKQNLEILEMLTSNFLTIFVMHDRWLLTGRCAYTGSCEKYMSLCDGGCPTQQEYPSLIGGEIADAFNRKHQLLRESENLIVVGNSNSTINWARYAFLNHLPRQQFLNLDNRFHGIYYGLDLEIFYPRDKALCRKKLGLPLDKFIIISGCQSMNDPRKGAKHLIEALEIAALENAMLVGFGYSLDSQGKFELYQTGFIDDPSVLALYYSAADLFVGPSLEESFGQTFIEAAACGTPAVGYRVGGVQEAISDGVSGRLVDTKNPEALAQIITELYYDRAQLSRLTATAPIYVANTFSLEASYLKFMAAIQEVNWLEKLQLNPATKFGVNKPKIAEPIYIDKTAKKSLFRDIWQGEDLQFAILRGFDHLEKPNQDLGISTSSRWTIWPESRFVITSDKLKKGQLKISGRNVCGEQIIKVYGEDELLLKEPVLNTAISQSNIFTVPVELQPGYNYFALKTEKYFIDGSNRHLAFLIENISFEEYEVLNNLESGEKAKVEQDILTSDRLNSWGFFTSEFFGDKPVRWLEKKGGIVAEVAVENAAKIQVHVLAAVGAEFLANFTVKINDRSIEGEVKQQSDSLWIFEGIIPTGTVVRGETCLIMLETSGVQQLEENDPRLASLLVEKVVLKPF